MEIAPQLTTDHEAFERFLGEERQPLVHFLRGHGVLLEDAQDIVQESLHKLTRYREVPLHALKPLLYRIALNTLCDARRRESLSRRTVNVAGPELLELPNEVLRPEQWAEHREELARVRDAIDRLPERCRQVYLLNRIDGLSYSQISADQGISVKAVEKHVSRALTLLRQLLSPSAGPLPQNPNS
ncbi:RNA polymerase sigma factor [Lysobacter enzymogenes]|uniref:RNA polymerase sigma factor n=1 Tax=Lysobacter enzymogenes TaxID=69 RepID=UPI00099DF1B9|nr:sigma-70 family RNA polymerase sigma factor [Lysobacter enzymogenes]UZW62193.1 sigma-70 family RNA polymerase sigma factor [Lysobacter enzymogenes]